MVSSPALPTEERPTRGIRFEHGQATDSGLDPAKRSNEDACHYAETPLGHLFVVCDGMGGHQGGKEASQVAVNTIFEVINAQATNAKARVALKSAIEEAARRVYALGGAADNNQRPGSTCVVFLLRDGQAEIAHLGDSRCYNIRGSQIYQLTRDHSMIQEMLDQGLVSKQQAIGHPDSNKITRALGMTRKVDVELYPEPVELYAGDLFLLCTDGLTDLARDQEIMVTIEEYLKQADISAVCQELVGLALRRGGHDNVTVQLVHILATGPKQLNTVAQEPKTGSHGVSPTFDERPGVSPTVVGSPLLDDRSPQQTITEAPAIAIEPPPPILPGPQARSASEVFRLEQTVSKLLKLVFALLTMIGILVAGLLWVLLLRDG